MTDLELVGSTPLPSFVSIGDDAVYREITSSSNGYDVEGRTIRLYKRGLVPWRAAIAMVVFASLAAVAVLILKCVAAFRRKRGETAKRRNLSEKGEDTSDSEGGVECAAVEESGGVSLPQQWASAEGHQEAVGLPPAKRQRLDSSSADGAAGETSRTQSEAAAAAGLLMLSRQPSVPSPPSETQMPPSQQSAEAVSPRPRREAAASEELMLLSQQQAAPSSSSDAQVPPSQQSAEGAPLALPVHLLVPQLYLLVLGHEGSLGHSLPSTSAGAVGGSFHGVSSAPSALPAFSSSDEPSSSSGLLPQRRDSPGAGRLHAFAWLPRLEQPDHREVFNPERALMAPVNFNDAQRMFQRMRELFAKDSLSPGEFTKVVRMAEMLVAHAIKYETTDLQKMKLRRFTHLLGRRFILLDLVISTFQLLGTEPSGIWWDQIKAVVPHVIPPRGTFRQHTGREQQAFRKNLAEGLSSAIATLKTGNRPSTRELVKLKRSMFCSSLAPKVFQQSLWDPWREDDEEAKRNGYTDV